MIIVTVLGQSRTWNCLLKISKRARILRKDSGCLLFGYGGLKYNQRMESSTTAISVVLGDVGSFKLEFESQ
jgi:hypothetical protein